MKLFIANTTKHIQEFPYRIPEFDRLFQQKIGIGDQVLIYQDSPRDVLDYIINQHTDTPKPFLVDVAEAAKHKSFVGLIYSFDNPVPAKLIEGVFESNTEAMKDAGQEIRKEAAAALESKLSEETNGAVSNVETQVIEQVKDGVETPNAINETISVQRGNKRK